MALIWLQKFKKSKKYFDFISLSTLFIGIIIGYISSLYFNQQNIDLSIKPYSSLLNFNFNVDVFLKILKSNFIVAFLLSIGGYYSGGVLTVLVLLLNGYYLGINFTVIHNTNLTFLEFSKFFIFHGILEFTAFLLFARIGYSGFYFYKKFLKEEKLKIDFHFKSYTKPSIILIIAAMIETLLISNL